MKIKLHLVSTILIVTFLITACEKDGKGNYIRATINGNSWETNSVSVETINTGSGTEPLTITGVLNNEMIKIRTGNPNPGSYPFRLDNVNPAILLSFTGEVFESSHRLKWSTATETDLASFNIESSTDGLSWIMVGTANPTGSISNYQVVPTNDAPAGIKYYYRLKVINTNGSFAYSTIVLISGNYVAAYRPPSGNDRIGYDGNLQIVAHDRSRRMITGRFNFKAKTTTGQLYTITNGEFQTSY